MHKQTRGSVALRLWMTKTATNQKQLAEKLTTAELKVHQTYVSALLLGRPCSLGVAVQIKRVTKIHVEDWTIEADADSGTVLATDTAKAG